VRSALLADPLVGGSAIGVEVRDGVVTLEGMVPDDATAARALDIARSVPGVRAVVDRLGRPGRPARFTP
jgi:osmotically-inducible protein OsmY